MLLFFMRVNWGYKKARLIYFIFLLSSSMVFPAMASPSDERDFERAFGDEDFVSIATGYRQSIARAPAVATSISDNDLTRLGVTDIDEVLETVPGLHVSYSPSLYTPIYVMRGIYSQNNAQVLVLINGVPITDVFLGDRGMAWGGMPIKNIRRVEVIRGPSSAVYGADAFAGVINIVTKRAGDERASETEMGVRRGSFDTHSAWFAHDTTWGKVDVALSLEGWVTDGFRESIAADAQTFLDSLSGTSSSLAPGPVNMQRKGIEASADFHLNAWRGRIGYQGRYGLGTGVGIAQALDPSGELEGHRLNMDLTYERVGVIKNWDIFIQANYLKNITRTEFILLPPGTSAGEFPEGVIGNPGVNERYGRFNFSAFYRGILRHNLRFDVGMGYSDLYKVKESKNFLYGSGGTLIPLGSVKDVSDDPNSVFIRPHDRSLTYVVAQDEWAFSNDWVLTAGLRHDNYSDFGHTTNPRLALVWAMKYNLTGKLLYGRAFRAPAFAELYNINNPVILGNPKLQPETISTWELVFDYDPHWDLNTKFNIFRYKMKDIIRFVADPVPATSDTAQNSGVQEGYGFEWEARWRPTRDWDIRGHWTWQHSVDKTGGGKRDAAYAPEQELYIQANWRFKPRWNGNVQANHVMNRKREEGDPRPPIKDYITVDLTIRAQELVRHWTFAASVRNLFDADAREPSLNGTLLPRDLPLAGRSVYLEVGYQF